MGMAPPSTYAAALGAWLQEQGPALGVALVVVLLTTLLLLLLARRQRGSSSSSSGHGGKGLPKSVAQKAYQSLRARELAWLRGLPRQTQAALLASSGGEGRKRVHGGPFPAHELRLHSGEVGMVLVGVKPCALVEDRGGMAAFPEAYAEEVLRPWMDAFGLAEYGFVLTRVAYPCRPPETRGHDGFQGAALFYWKAHPEASFVESIFLGGHDCIPGRLLGEALGYPGREGRLAVPIAYRSLDTLPYAPPALPTLTEEEEDEEDEEEEADDTAVAPAAPAAAAADASLRVPLLRFVGREEDAQRIGQHFRRAEGAFASVYGQPLGLDLGACEAWEAGALAKLLLAAFPSVFDEEEMGGVSGLDRCLESGALMPYEWMRRRFAELPPVIRMLRLVEKLQREKERGGGLLHR